MFKWIMSFFAERRKARRERLEAQFESWQRTIDQCVREIDDAHRRIQEPSYEGGAMSLARVIVENRQTIDHLRGLQEEIRRKLG